MVFYVRRTRSKAQRRIYYAPPVVAFAASEFYYKRVVYAGFKRQISVDAGGEVLLSDCGAGSIIIPVLFQNSVAYFFYFVEYTADNPDCRLLVDALRGMGSDEFYYFVLDRKSVV